VTRRRALLFVAAAPIGVGAAAALIATRDDSGPAPRAASTTAAASATLAGNQIRLSHAESLRLVDWATRLRACVARRGVVLAAPVAHAKEIDLAIRRGPAGAALERSVIACGDALGGPPRHSSLQLRRGRLVLYLPRRCLLDKKVVRGEGPAGA
jgi:hypothetical protein